MTVSCGWVPDWQVWFRPPPRNIPGSVPAGEESTFFQWDLHIQHMNSRRSTLVFLSRAYSGPRFLAMHTWRRSRKCKFRSLKLSFPAHFDFDSGKRWFKRRFEAGKMSNWCPSHLQFHLTWTEHEHLASLCSPYVQFMCTLKEQSGHKLDRVAKVGILRPVYLTLHTNCTSCRSCPVYFQFEVNCT